MFEVKKKLIIFLIIFASLNFKAYSDEKLIESLKHGEKVIFIRHALAPGSGDPTNFELHNCSTQRNLNEEGVKQSKKIGLFFKRNQIPIDKVLSSQWCRCKDTAKFAFKNFETFDALNSFYSQKFQKNKSKQMKNLKKYLKKWESKKNLILVTHYVVILETLNKAASSGEILITDKNFNFIGSISKY